VIFCGGVVFDSDGRIVVTLALPVAGEGEGGGGAPTPAGGWERGGHFGF